MSKRSRLMISFEISDGILNLSICELIYVVSVANRSLNSVLVEKTEKIECLIIGQKTSEVVLS